MKGLVFMASKILMLPSSQHDSLEAWERAISPHVTLLHHKSSPRIGRRQRIATDNTPDTRCHMSSAYQDSNMATLEKGMKHGRLASESTHIPNIWPRFSVVRKLTVNARNYSSEMGAPLVQKRGLHDKNIDDAERF